MCTELNRVDISLYLASIAAGLPSIKSGLDVLVPSAAPASPNG